VIGTLLRNRYRIDAQLGEGGMGVVYRAHDSLLQREVAIKTLSPAMFGTEGARRFVREAQAVAKLNHPHIVSIFDAVEESGQLAIVMELVEGQTLRELLPVPVGRLVEIALQVLEGLEYAHGQGVVHRDIKPENIIVTAADGTAKLMDFGLARSEGRSRLTVTGMVVGTVAYLAPEQALGGQVDGRSDLYALGAVLYEAVAGRPPFESEDPISVITQHINVPPVAPHWHNPGVPPALENAILKLLAKDPARRYQSAREAAEALRAARKSFDTAAVGIVPGAGLAGPGPEKLAGPELVERLGRSPLVGREPELGRLKELIDRAIAGQGGVVLLNGPLGIGKTRLAEEATTYARLRGVTVVSGNAYESAPPYEPFARALHDLARGVDSETLSARLGEFAPELVGLIPELSRQLPRVSERAAGSLEDRKNRLFAGVAHFLGAMAVQNPVLVFLDDMHFADAATVELLQHAARRSQTGRVLLVAAYRAEDVPSSPAGQLFGQVVHTLGREGFCTAIALRPLSEEQVVDLIQLMANHRTRPVRFGHRIHEVTEGNPYFLEEVIKALFEQGTLYIKDGQWSTDFDDIRDYSLLETPTSIRSAVEARLRNLSESTRQVLTHAAVIAAARGAREQGDFSFDALLRISGLDETALLDRVEEALRAQFVREIRGAGADVYAFTQPIVRRVLYESIPRRRRRLLHRQAGEALEQLYARRLDAYVEALAAHFAEAEDTEKVLDYARRASRKAADVSAYAEAIRYLQLATTAAEELDRPVERLEIMEELADLLFRVGRRNETVRAYEEAFRFWRSLPGGSRVEGARLCRKIAELRRWGFADAPTREYIAEGLRLLKDQPSHPEYVRLTIAQAGDLYWLRPEAEADYAAAEERAREGYRLAESIGSLLDMSYALDVLAGIYWQTANFPKMLEATAQRTAIVEQLDDAKERHDLASMLTNAHTFLGNFTEAQRHGLVSYDIAVKSRNLHSLMHSTTDMAFLHMLWNRWDEAETWCRRYEEAEAQAGAPDPLRRSMVAVRTIDAAVRGDLGEARRWAEEFEKAPSGNPLGRRYFAVLIGLATEDIEATRAVLTEALRLADTPWAKLEMHSLALEFAVQTSEWRYIDELGDATLERARRSGGRGYVGRCCRSLGAHRREHGLLVEAEALLAEAAEIFRAMDCRWELAKTLRELVLLRRAQDRPGDARALLQEALTHFEALRALPDVERTRALM
jgi:tetratricopeptide (TPR) repeat protein